MCYVPGLSIFACWFPVFVCLLPTSAASVTLGKEFEMDPETFTLANLFAMELSNYSDVISDIVGGAIKELGIETGVKDVAEVCYKR